MQKKTVQKYCALQTVQTPLPHSLPQCPTAPCHAVLCGVMVQSKYAYFFLLLSYSSASFGPTIPN